MFPKALEVVRNHRIQMLQHYTAYIPSTELQIKKAVIVHFFYT